MVARAERTARTPGIVSSSDSLRAVSDDEDGGGTAVNRVGRPQVVVIGGPNGAGKTSAAPELLRDTVGVETFVNADLIAEGLAGFSP